MVDTTSNVPLIGGNPSQTNGIDWQAVSKYAQQQAQNSQSTVAHANPISGVAKSIMSGVTGATNKVGNALDAFGAKNFNVGTTTYSGMGPGTMPWNQPGMTASNAAAGEAGTSVTGGFGDIAGGALSGYGIGTLLGGWLGENKKGSQIGGLIGGGLGAAALGGLTGVSVGATLGSVVPGIGTVIGAVAGSVLGGMFGGKKPNPAGTLGGLTVGADGTLAGGSYSGKHLSAADFTPYTTDYQSYLQQQLKKYGISTISPDASLSFGYDVNGSSFSGGSSTNNSAITVANKATPGTQAQYVFDPNDNNSKNTAYQSAFNQLLTYSGIDPNTIKPVLPTTANEVRISATPGQSGPSDWDKFLANYKTQHPQPA